MSKNNKDNPQNNRKIFTRKEADLELKRKLLESPELFITEKGSDEHLDKLALLVQLRSGDEFILSDYVAEVMAEYESKFKKYWWYRLADLYAIDRTIMDRYVKPDFARKFLVQFVYGRFPYLVLRTLRSRNKKTSKQDSRTKLFQHLTKKASAELDVVIEQVYTMMGMCQTPHEFKMMYSKTYRMYFQLELF